MLPANPSAHSSAARPSDFALQPAAAGLQPTQLHSYLIPQLFGARHPTLSAAQLSDLYLTDQGYDLDSAVQRLLKARRGLRVQAGETDSDSMAWSCVMQQTGRGYGDGLYGRW